MSNMNTMNSNILVPSFRIIYIVFNFCGKITTSLRQKVGHVKNFSEIIPQLANPLS